MQRAGLARSIEDFRGCLIPSEHVDGIPRCRQRPSSRRYVGQSATGTQALDVFFAIDVAVTPPSEGCLDRSENGIGIPTGAISPRYGISNERGDRTARARCLRIQEQPLFDS